MDRPVPLPAQTRPASPPRPGPIAAARPLAPVPAPGRPLRVRDDTPLRRFVDRLIGGSSLVPDDPVLDMRHFPWTCELRSRWRAIRDEALAVAIDHREARPGRCAGPLAAGGMARSFRLYRDGDPIGGNVARCPATAAAVATIPGVVGAFFSILAPGTHCPSHRGRTKGLVTCHLGLIVPRDGDVRMRVGDRMVRWAEGETLVFDDTCDHEAWNDSAGTRVALVLQFRRPLAQPGRWIADRVLAARRRARRLRAVP